MPMNPDVKTRWLEALRSGRYEQTQKQLCRKGGDGNVSYCCLGVLVDVLRPGRLAEDGRVVTKKGEFVSKWEVVYNTSMMPTPTLREEAGVTEQECNKLWRMNDGWNPLVLRDIDQDPNVYEPHTFAEIADYIEANL